MNRDGTAILGVIGHFEKLIAGEGNIGAVACYQEMALFVVPLGASHDVNEFLVYLIEQVKALLLSFCAAAVTVPQGIPAPLLIEGLKHQLFGILGEAVAYLCPDALILVHTFVLVLGEFLPPAAVPVDVEDDVHIRIYCPAHDLICSVHKLRAYVVVPCHKVRPCHRHTQGVKPRCLVALYHILGDDGAAPGGLVASDIGAVYPAAAAFKGVAKVYAQPHVRDYLLSGLFAESSRICAAAAGADSCRCRKPQRQNT